MTDNLLAFDQVVALSQQTINAQIAFMMGETISDKVNMIVGTGSPPVGIQGTIDAPYIDVNLPTTINPQQVQFNIPFKTGTATYSDILGEHKSIDLAGWRMALTVNIAKRDFTSAQVRATQAAQKAAKPFLDQSIYTVYAIVVDLADVDMSTATFFDASGAKVETDGMVALLHALLQHMVSDGNPFILSINPQQVPQATGLDAFRPTSVMFETHLNNNQNAHSPYSTYNMLIMNEGKPAPYTPTTLPKFAQPALVPADANVDGRLYIAKAQFDSGYVEAIILPRLRTAMTAFFPSSAQFQRSDSGWAIHYATSDADQNDNHGAFLGEKKFEHYVGLHPVGHEVTFGTAKLYQATLTNYDFTIAPAPHKSTNGKLVLSGTGVMSQSQNFYVHLDFGGIVKGWRSIGSASAELDFTVVPTIEAGNGGKLTIAPNIQKGTVGKTHSVHTPSELPGKISQRLIEWAMGILKIKSISDRMDGMADEILDQFDSAFDSFENFATGALADAQQSVILPGAHSLFFNNIAFDDQLNVQFDLVIKQPN